MMIQLRGRSYWRLTFPIPTVACSQACTPTPDSHCRAQPRPSLIPDNAILIDAKGSRILVVDSSNKIHIKTVKLGRDFGTKTEILGGLDAQDRVVQNPADDLHEGMPVSVESATQGPSK